MTPDKAAALRAPFPDSKIGKLPRVSCGKCRESHSRVCDSHRKAKCAACGQWITSAHIHLDYVGHADVTDRFLEVDPDWSWEPFALDGNGLPAMDDNGGLWIRLTILKVTRIGYGDAEGKRGANAVKEAVGDALRNAGLRFGVALDLWRKEIDQGEDAPPPRQVSQPDPAEAWPHDPEDESANEAEAEEFARLMAAVEAAGDETALKEHGVAVRKALSGRKITRLQYDRLARRAAARMGEMNGGQP